MKISKRTQYVIFLGILLAILILPTVSFAQIYTTTVVSPTCTTEGLGKAICEVQKLLNSIVPLLLALGVVYFVWGVVQYVIGGDEEAKSKGRDRIIYGIIGLTVIAGMWGLVALVVNTLGVGAVNAPSLTTVTTAAASGSACTVGTDFQTFLGFFTCIINNSIIPLIFAIAIVMFIWGAVNFFIINGEEEAKRAQGKQFMIWGIIALTVMLSVWGLVGLLGSTFNIGTSVLPQVHPSGQ